MQEDEESVLEEHQVNQVLTAKARKDAKYQRFLNWIKANGTLIDPRVMYPTAFGISGCIGVSCSESIPAYQAVIAIPKKIIIDVESVKQIPQFTTVVNENPRLFNGSEQSDAAFNTLSLFLIYEHLKGDKSFYYPYFEASECKNLLLHWSRAELEQLENREISENLIAYKDELQFQFINFLRVIRKYDKLFPPEINNESYKKIFEWAYEFVMTRAFGWSVPSASLIPFADMLNHGDKYLDHFLIDLKREAQAPVLEGELYAQKSKKCNLSIFRKEFLNISPEEVKKLVTSSASDRTKYLARHKKLLEAASTAKSQKKQLSEKQQMYCITHQQYNSGVHKLRQLTFAQSSCSEDNDTDEDDIADFAYKAERMKIDNKSILKGNTTVPLSKSLQKYWELYQQPKLKGKLHARGNKKAALLQQQQNKTKGGMENEDSEEEKEQSEEEKQEISVYSQKSEDPNESEDTEDEKLGWVVDSNPADVYFVLYTNRVYGKNEQLYNFYGRRSNRFLLLGYNFATMSNKYDSFCFRMVVQPLSCSKPVAAKLIFSKMINTKDSSGIIITRELKLKKQRVCIELINHCRCIVMANMYKERLTDSLPTVIPLERQIEQAAINLAKEIVKYQLDQYQSDNETDEEILQNKVTPPRLYTAVVIRLSHKIILREQLKLLDRCLQYLGRWKNQKIKLQEKEMADVSRIREYLYELERSLL